MLLGAMLEEGNGRFWGDVMSVRTCFYGALIVVAGFGVTGAASVLAREGAAHEWGYGVENGPSHWGEISPEFATCATGQRQSPVDIGDEMLPAPSELTLDYVPGPATVVNNGHTVQVNVADGNVLSFGDKRYKLLQFHFHTPSENTFHGMHFPVEAHFVHRDDDGRLAVVAVMFSPGDGGPLDTLPIPSAPGEDILLDENFDPAGILPDDLGYVVFEGSLTTPPCSEGVRWIVLKQTVDAKIETFARIGEVVGRNNRPVNPLNGRELRETQ